jgi:hypothetical protein
VPERKPGTRGKDWEGGRTWAYDFDTQKRVHPFFADASTDLNLIMTDAVIIILLGKAPFC